MTVGVDTDRKGIIIDSAPKLHHIDGNYKNTTEENLQIVCPNCHSLKTMVVEG
jgi:hypothetical protein